MYTIIMCILLSILSNSKGTELLQILFWLIHNKCFGYWPVHLHITYTNIYYLVVHPSKLKKTMTSVVGWLGVMFLEMADEVNPGTEPFLL